MSCGATGGAMVDKKKEDEKKEMFTDFTKMQIGGIYVGTILGVVAVVLAGMFLYFMFKSKSPDMKGRFTNAYGRFKKPSTWYSKNSTVHPVPSSGNGNGNGEGSKDGASSSSPQNGGRRRHR